MIMMMDLRRYANASCRKTYAHFVSLCVAMCRVEKRLMPLLIALYD